MVPWSTGLLLVGSLVAGLAGWVAVCWAGGWVGWVAGLSVCVCVSYSLEVEVNLPTS